ncbi:MFS general substrate transporter [Phellopilus nigrolimitatus]|nr:MFS general substrate transporter [Phellopilus nigrolimitatus]
MASITPRMSLLLAEDYFDEHSVNDSEDTERQNMDGRTPLDRTIDRIGMGIYQWTLLTLCGFGWLADNMWIQTIAIILPRVQQHYDVSDSYIGYLSSVLFAGMMIGAVGWGSCSDILGRSTAFNLTLFFTAIFGLMASYAPSFSSLCIVLFFLGTSGSMPTDGTLLLEHMPKGKQYLVTALSVFFSFGSVLSAVVGILIIPGHSCPPKNSTSSPCDVETMNMGWKYLLMAIGFITLAFFLARIVFFRLHESPRYLVHAGRPEEAVLNLQKISRFNGSELSLDLEDVIDQHNAASGDEEQAPFIPKSAERTRGDVRVLFEAGAESNETEPFAVDGVSPIGSSKVESRPSEVVHYDSTGSSEVPLDAHTFATPANEDPPHRVRQPTSSAPGASSVSALSPEPKPATLPTPARPRLERSTIATPSRRSSLYEAKAKFYWALPYWIRKPLWAWLDKLALVLSPEWRRTTVLVWAMWCFMALAYTMFNVFLPKMLEMGTGGPAAGNAPKTLEATMWDVVIFTIAGCPGALIGAYMIESSFGRRWSLAGSTFVTAAFCLAFTFAESSLAVRLSTTGISLSSTTMWAILYGWTPEIFGTAVRGTACGSASALSRIGGMIAPVLGGALLVVSRSLPVYTSAIVFVLAGLCTLILRVEDVSRRSEIAAPSH